MTNKLRWIGTACLLISLSAADFTTQGNELLFAVVTPDRVSTMDRFGNREEPEPSVPEPEEPEPSVPEPEVPEPEVPEPNVPEPEVPEPGTPKPEA